MKPALKPVYDRMNNQIILDSVNDKLRIRICAKYTYLAAD